jgi:hypothetical protein
MTAPQGWNARGRVRAGPPDEAIELITRLLAMNYEDALTIYVLQKDPRWDSLRDNPKFQALLKTSS